MANSVDPDQTAPIGAGCSGQGWSTHTRTCTRTYSSTFFSVLSCTLYLAKFMSTCTRTYLSTVTKILYS